MMGLGRLFESRASVVTAGSMFLREEDFPSLTLAGVSMSQQKAMSLTAIHSAVRVISDPISTFPIGYFIRVNGERRPYGPRPAWLEQPDPDPAVARSDHYQQVMVSLLLAGNYYGRKLYDSRGEVLAIRPIDPSRVNVRQRRSGFVEFVVDDYTVVDAKDMVHITDLRKPGALKGSSRIDDLKEALGIGKALDEYVGRYFGEGATGQRLVYEVPQEMTEEQAEALQDRISKRTEGLRKSNRALIASGGAKIDRLSDNAEQAQLSSAREFFVMEVARAFKLPPSKLGVTTPGTRAYASVEQDNIDFATTTLAFYVSKIEEAYSKLVYPQQSFIKFNMDALLRGDITSRYAAYATGIQSGFLTIDDIRKREDLALVAGGDALRVPLALINIDAAGLIADEKRVQMLQSLVQSGFQPEDAAKAVGLPSIAHTGLPSVQLQPPADPAADPVQTN